MDFEAIVIGCGPAGSSASTILAQAGFSVAQIERDAFPRFHIGESLLPKGNQLLSRLGVLDKVRAAGFLEKHGAEFITPDRSSAVHNVFENGLLPGLDSAFEVERASFDQLLLDHARDCGAEIIQPAKVESIEATADGWRLQIRQSHGSKVLSCRWLIDASGRTCLLARHLKLPKVSLPYPRRMAVYAHFESVPLQPGKRAGNIVIIRAADGWFWVIPLAEGRASVGFVADLATLKAFPGDAEAFFREQIAQTPWLRQHLKDASLATPIYLEADFSYMFESFAGPRHFLTGDAACFIDPIFSSGVAFALESGIEAAERIIKARNQTKLPRASQRSYTARFRKRVKTMRNLIDMFYDPDGFAVFMQPTCRFKLAPAVNAVVAGESNPPWCIRWRLLLLSSIVRLNRKLHFIPRPSIDTMPADHRNV